MVVGGAVGWISGKISGDTGNALANDVAMGALSGFVLGWTDGASLLGFGLNLGLGGAAEAGRQYLNCGSITSLADVVGNAALSAIGGSIGGYVGNSAKALTGQAAADGWKAASALIGDVVSGTGSVAAGMLEAIQAQVVSNPLGDPEFQKYERSLPH